MPGIGTTALVSAYAARFNPSLLRAHGVASPLGLWLLLALVGPATQGAHRQDLETVLGTTVDDAAARAAVLVHDPHPAVLTAAAVWDRELGAAFDRWTQTLPESVQRGPIPSKADADRWAYDHTRGLIGEFPARIDHLTRLLLVSALATDISWTTPLDADEQLGGEFGQKIKRSLTFRSGFHGVFETDAAGQVAVAAPETSSALQVLSVIAAPGVPADRVDVAAHQVAAALAGDEQAARPLPEAELIDGHAWTVTERREQRSGGPERLLQWQSYLPAWSARSDHDLANAPGVEPVLQALATFARPDDRPVNFAVRQSAVASYTRSGFKAAAVSVIGMRAAGMPSFREVLVRRIELRFNRPYVVLACAARDDGPPAWRGMPVFSAWITEPEEAHA
ncbi:serpin family protein [Mycobacteroides immunogenum]|uniref:Serpin domain-containing protein n=1 Tax=Mycobacteroides immunogenum TaxID=83262 RepID=A0A7V8RWD4_9MYCO|nr:hypothetical protein [Mycobacteroides immunogenum]AMT72854.1 hypothetical protein ABG82_23935 [Mycobacteroides immunogenum]ANO06015.1 hypothetical protein BAB75_24210 [Mycobacteroides immunogenum]KIU41330.1 hypothetical protein TL11_07275 [Mycobacteroides immunogenum]KPG07885.1 hypothetical protein AN909_16135 [Mycobacteroides immunogenum]KPG09476.1 hypothetical protein AN910_16655 [Mycobacteroides immunogenum]